MSIVDPNQSRQGVIYGLISYGCWGLIPLYFKLVAEVSPLEVLAQRVVWSFVFLALVISVLGRWGQLRDAMRSGNVVLTLAASTLLLALNWFIYIYAVTSNQVVEASMGYFLNPLVNVLIGVTILKERLRPGQFASIVLAAIGMALLGVPLIAVSLAITFAFYGLLRKTAAVDGLLGLAIETILLAPLALAYIALIESNGSAAFNFSDPTTCIKLMASGVVTAVPLLFFTAAARRLRFSTLGFLQYVAPTMQFLIAVLLFDEPLSQEKLIAFGFIWTAVAIYMYDSLRSYQQQRTSVLKPASADL